jgi:hypothetical protein
VLLLRCCFSYTYTVTESAAYTGQSSKKPDSPMPELPDFLLQAARCPGRAAAVTNNCSAALERKGSEPAADSDF